MNKKDKFVLKWKQVVYWFILICIVASTPFLVAFGYYGYKKLTLAYNYCGSYGQLDDEIGWVLAKNANSCMSLSNRLKNITYFDSKIYTNEKGFRDSAVGKKVPVGGIVTVGDSWTFGYGVNYEETYPKYLQDLVGIPTVNAGIPAYGTAQTLLLLERHIGDIKPTAIVYLELGLIFRSCDAVNMLEKPKNTLLLQPLFWWNHDSKIIEIVKPIHGRVTEEAKKNNYPGGYFTSGYDNWKYLLVVKPISIIREVIQKLNSLITPYRDNQKVDTNEDHTEDMLKYVLERFISLSKLNNSTFILIDAYGNGMYEPYIKQFEKEKGVKIIYIDRETWNKEVAIPGEKLKSEDARVPMDGHFGPGKNKLIAEMIAKRLKRAQN